MDEFKWTRWEFAAAPVFIGVDWAKPSSDCTVADVIIVDNLDEVSSAEHRSDVLAWFKESMPARVLEAPQSESDRIWSLLVLAAESSKYG